MGSMLAGAVATKVASLVPQDSQKGLSFGGFHSGSNAKIFTHLPKNLRLSR